MIRSGFEVEHRIKQLEDDVAVLDSIIGVHRTRKRGEAAPKGLLARVIGLEAKVMEIGKELAALRKECKKR